MSWLVLAGDAGALFVGPIENLAACSACLQIHSDLRIMWPRTAVQNCILKSGHFLHEEKMLTGEASPIQE